ncbi:MAG: hypothetical protein O2856_15265 [Planctomycetota bacterium]|nr:hypothetical protein [Planctomycetota bacterium]
MIRTKLWQMTNCFIIIFLIFIWCWDYPADHPAKRFISKLGFPFVYLGFWHGWAMFAPEPIHVNRRLRAVLTFADGVTEDWCPLGPENSGKLINMLYARSFKYEHSLLSPRVGYLYIPLCEFLMRQVQGDGRKLQSIVFFRDFQSVNPIGSENVYSEKKSIAFYHYDAAKRTGAMIPLPATNGGRPTPNAKVVMK